MPSNKKTQTKNTMSLAMPIILGLSSFVLLFTMIQHEVINDQIVIRYLAGHTVSKVTTALFLIGLASLVLIAKDVSNQIRLLSQIRFAVNRTTAAESMDTVGTVPAVPQATTDQLQSQLNGMDSRRKKTYLWHRLQTALNFIERNKSADGLDGELKYASELDLDEKQDRYSFVRIMIWAIPMLGFLGTVLGISEALGGIDVGDDNNFQAMMGNLRSSLYVAFDTTAVALTLAIVLMFAQFIIDRFETRLLSGVDLRAREELSAHWNITNQEKDSYVKAVESIGERVVESTEKLVLKQVKLWRSNIEAAESAWVHAVSAAQDAVSENLTEALGNSTKSLSENLSETIRRSDDAVAHRWEQWQVTLSENTRLLASHQAQIVDQVKHITDALQQVGDLAETKEMYAKYLRSLPDTSEISHATSQLSTAIRILEYRLTDIDPELESDEDTNDHLDKAA